MDNSKTTIDQSINSFDSEEFNELIKKYESNLEESEIGINYLNELMKSINNITYDYKEKHIEGI
jgi:hypothetical protein